VAEALALRSKAFLIKKSSLPMSFKALQLPGVASYAPTAWLSILEQTVKFLRQFFV
jgi:hypothetical protein